MTDDPQANADGMFLELQHTVTGPQKVVGPIVTMSNAVTGSTLSAPTLGEHTRAILSGIGLEAKEVEHLVGTGVIRCED